jgi:hypothetical protein
MRGKPTASNGSRLALAALVTVALAGCGSSQTTSSSPTPSVGATQHSSSADSTNSTTTAASAGACAASQLKLAYAGTEGATGHLEVTLALRNVSARQCTIRGYPAARLLNRSGRPLPMHVKRGGGFFPDTLQSPRAVVLSPGARARFGVSFVTNNEYKGARICRTAVAVMSLAPGEASWLRVSLHTAPHVAPCGDQLVLSPVYS